MGPAVGPRDLRHVPYEVQAFIRGGQDVRYIIIIIIGERERANLVLQLGRGVVIYIYIYIYVVISYVVGARQEFTT